MASGIPLWQLLPISFGWDKEIVLQPAELALLAGTKNHELVTKVQEANSAHRIYTRAANRVGELKLELANSGLAASASGEVIQFEATSAQYAGIAHVINQLEALSEKLGSDLAEATHQAVECGRQVPKVLKDFYTLEHLVGLVFDEIEDSSDDAISHANQ